MRRSSFAMVFSLAVAFALPGRAHAQSAPVEDTDARTLFQLGQSAFDDGRYQAALDYFQQAYDLSHRPQLLYNIGQAADRLRLDRRALEAFESFLRDAPESPQHTPTRARVEVLRAAVEQAEARERAAAEAPTPAQTAAAAPVAVAQPDAPRSSGSPALGWAIAGGGGGALVVGAVFLALGLSDKSAVENAADGSTFASIQDEYDRASTRITVGTVLLGVGAAATATGVVLALRSGPDEDADTSALDLRVGPNGLLLRGSF